MAIGGNFSKPGMGGAAPAPLPSGGLQGGSTQLQQNAQQMVPNMGQFNGNPRGVYNTNFQGQGNAPSYLQQTNLGRYVPPTMQQWGPNGGFNSNQWNNQGGWNYNLPGSYGSPQGQGQFAPMPGQFAQYMQPNQLSGNTFGFGNPYGDAMGNDLAYIQEMFGARGGRMPPGKDGRPLPNPNDPRNDPMYSLFNNPGQGGGAPMPGMGRRGGFRGRMAEESPLAEIPAYDRPDTRNYNMNALYQMMAGGF